MLATSIYGEQWFTRTAKHDNVAAGRRDDFDVQETETTPLLRSEASPATAAAPSVSGAPENHGPALDGHAAEPLEAAADNDIWPVPRTYRVMGHIDRENEFRSMFVYGVNSDREGLARPQPPAELMRTVGPLCAKFISLVLPTRLIYIPTMEVLDRTEMQNIVQASVGRKLSSTIKSGTGPKYRTSWPYLVIRLVKEALAYAILSHRWMDDETTFQDMTSPLRRFRLRLRAGDGFRKLKGFCAIARSTYGCDWAWADTCCIDKTSSSELDEAIRSMYRWYQDAEVCIVYLADTLLIDDMARDVWFTRGWTLQELLAPQRIKFYNRRWQRLTECDNDKLLRREGGLREVLSGITGIPQEDVENFEPGPGNVMQKMAWAATRQTTRAEDRAYSLIGIFDVSLVTGYGENERAFYRLQLAIMEKSNDVDLFVWRGRPSRENSMIAGSPECFGDGTAMQRRHDIPKTLAFQDGAWTQTIDLDGFPARGSSTFSLTNAGLRIDLILFDVSMVSIPHDYHLFEPATFEDGGIRWMGVAGVELEGEIRTPTSTGFTAYLSPDDHRLLEWKAAHPEESAWPYTLGILDYAGGDEANPLVSYRNDLLRRPMRRGWLKSGPTDASLDDLDRLIVTAVTTGVYTAVLLRESRQHLSAGRCLTRVGESVTYVKRPEGGWGRRAQTVFIR